MRQQQRVLDSMARIRDLIQRQQQALAEQRVYDAQTCKPTPSEADEDSHSFMDKMEGSGGFAGADAKKRRGRAAPPGRCHSCNRAETPEWRRGPDGARTLCNACGLRKHSVPSPLGALVLTAAFRLCQVTAEDGFERFRQRAVEAEAEGILSWLSMSSLNITIGDPKRNRPHYEKD